MKSKKIEYILDPRTVKSFVIFKLCVTDWGLTIIFGYRIPRRYRLENLSV